MKLCHVTILLMYFMIKVSRCQLNIESQVSNEYDPHLVESVVFSGTYQSKSENGSPKKKELYLKYDNGNSDEAVDLSLDLLNHNEANRKIEKVLKKLKHKNNVFAIEDIVLRQNNDIIKGLDMLQEVYDLKKDLDHKIYKAKYLDKKSKKYKHKLRQNGDHNSQEDRGLFILFPDVSYY